MNRAYRRYVGASGAALGVDLGCFALLLAGGLAPAVAAGLGCGVGAIAHWWLSSRIVFADRLAPAGHPRRMQQARYLASVGAGVALTTGLVGLGVALGVAAWIARAGAILVSFQATWLLRRHLVFAA